jgi:AAA domain
MSTPIDLPPHIRVASYETNQRNPRYRGNKLIEALPLPLSEDELVATLEFLPPFDPESRKWEGYERLQELMTLTGIMVPLAAHVQLARAIERMMRQGYVGRRPMSRDHIAIYHDINDSQNYRQPFRQTADTLTSQLSTALIGVSGMGKTTTVRRYLAHIPQVIYHPELNLYQVTYIHFEMPSTGKGVKSLLGSIIEQLDELIPGSNYYEEYVGRSRASESAMQHSVSRLLNKHCVGMLIPDEVQNVANTRKEDQVVMTELTTLSNKSKAPILYIGTNKADRILGTDFRMARRGTDLGLGDWHALPRYEGRDAEKKLDGEWVDFMRVLWRYQWLREPIPLDTAMLDVFYECTQGILDLGIKLFILSQGRAIIDSTEQLSEQLVRDVYAHELRRVHPMVEALRDNDMVALMKFEDIKPLSASEMLSELERRYRSSRMRAASVRPGSQDFEERMQMAGEALGIPPADAAALAKQINEQGTAKNMFEAAQQMGKLMSPPKPVSKPKGTRSKTAAAPALPDLSGRPLDYRNAVVAAQLENTTVVEQLLKRHMLPQPEELICLD